MYYNSVCIFLQIVPVFIILCVSCVFMITIWSSFIFSPVIDTKNERYLIYYCTDKHTHCGGIGDRIKGMMSTYMMAVATRRKFGLIMTSPCPLEDYQLPSDIDWKVPQRILNKKNVKVIRLTNENNAFNFSSVDLDSIFNETVFYVQTGHELRTDLLKNRLYSKRLAVFGNMTCNNFYGHFLRKMFTPSEKLHNRVSQFLIHARSQANKKLICAQLRMGKNPTIPNDSFSLNSQSDLKIVWRFLRSYNDGLKYSIFVTTDSEAVRKKAARLFKNQIIDTAGEIIHPVRSKMSTCGGYEKAWLDNMILEYCDVLLISKSGYGRMGAFRRSSDNNLFIFVNGRIYKAKHERKNSDACRCDADTKNEIMYE